MKGNSGFQIGTGVTSILMIFVVLCLTTFGILSYTSANSEMKLSRKTADYIESYYDAYSELMKEVAALDKEVLAGTVTDESKTLKKELNDTQNLVMELNIDKANPSKRVDIKRCYVENEGGGSALEEEIIIDMWGN